MTVPPNILAALPKLPEDLEYRFVNKHMILLDVHANLIVDLRVERYSVGARPADWR